MKLQNVKRLNGPDKKQQKKTDTFVLLAVKIDPIGNEQET